MKTFRLLLNDNFYFWLLGLSFIFISYLSIYEPLVANSPLSNSSDSKFVKGLSAQHFLIPVIFIKNFTLFLFSQILSIYILKLFFEVQSEGKSIIISIFLLGCSIHYFLIKLV